MADTLIPPITLNMADTPHLPPITLNMADTLIPPNTLNMADTPYPSHHLEHG